MSEYLVQNTSLTQIADAIRDKADITGNILFPDGFIEAIQNIESGIKLPTLNNQGTFDDLASGKQLIDANGSVVIGRIPVASDNYSGFEYVNVTTGEMSDIVDGEKFTSPTYQYSAPANRILYKTCTLDTTTGKITLSEPLNTNMSDGAEQKANYSTYRYFYGDLSDGSSDSSVYRYSNLSSNTGQYLTTWSWTYYLQCTYFDLDVNFKSTEDVIIRKTKTGKVSVSSEDFGNAKPEDVIAGKTFTSANGFKITGTYERSDDSGITLPEIADDVLGSASDLASGKQLIGADGNIVTGTATILKSGEIANGMAINNELKLCSYTTVSMGNVTGDSVTINKYEKNKLSVASDGTISGTGGIGVVFSRNNDPSEMFENLKGYYITVESEWYYVPSTATCRIQSTTTGKTVYITGINPVFILA